MHDPVAVPVLGAPGYVWLWALTALAFFLFGRKAWSYVRVLRAALPEPRWDRPLARARLFVRNVLLQRRLIDEPVIGLAHAVIFWAFVFYATAFFWDLVRGLFPFLPLPYAREAAWMSFALDFFGGFGLVALAVAAVRRYVVRPPRLEQSRDAGIILALISTVLVSSLAGRAFSSLATAMWWVHMVTVLGFLAYLPYSKHLHLLASPFGVLFGALERGGIPPQADSEGLTWRQSLSGLACAECGRCDRACPALASGASLSPKELMHRVKLAVRAGNAGSGDLLAPADAWACATCYACMARCPVMNEHIPIVIGARRRLVLNGDMDAGLQEALKNVSRYGNSFGVSPRARTKWTAALDFKIKDARREAVEYLWFLGDYASLDPRTQPATCATARLLRRAGVDFGILYEAEQNSGNDVRRAGEEGLFELVMEKNLKALGAARFSKIVTTDPHTYHALKNEYPRANGARTVVHYTELFAELLDAGKLPPRARNGVAAAYHDPCYLGRYNGVFDAPRRALGKAGVSLIEMPRNRDNSFCCGAGGGRIWMEDVKAAGERPAESRVREAAALPGVDTLVAACPKDLVMFQDAVKTAGLESKLKVKDFSEVLEEAYARA